MSRNDVLHWFILGFGLAGAQDELGRATYLSELWTSARKKCFECNQAELLDALYTLSREEAALIKVVSAGEGAHPISFARVRNTNDWPNYFTAGPFSVKVLPEGKLHYQKLSEELEKGAQPLSFADLK